MYRCIYISSRDKENITYSSSKSEIDNLRVISKLEIIPRLIDLI